MAVEKVIGTDDVAKALKELGIVSSSAGAGDADKLVKTGADGYLNSTVMPAGDFRAKVCHNELTGSGDKWSSKTVTVDSTVEAFWKVYFSLVLDTANQYWYLYCRPNNNNASNYRFIYGGQMLKAGTLNTSYNFNLGATVFILSYCSDIQYATSYNKVYGEALIIPNNAANPQNISISNASTYVASGGGGYMAQSNCSNWHNYSSQLTSLVFFPSSNSCYGQLIVLGYVPK